MWLKCMFNFIAVIGNLLYYLIYVLKFYLVLFYVNVIMLNIVIYVLKLFVINLIIQVWRTRKELPLSC